MSEPQHDDGDEDRRPLFNGWLNLFAYVADNGNALGPKLTKMLVDEFRYERQLLAEAERTEP